MRITKAMLQKENEQLRGDAKYYRGRMDVLKIDIIHLEKRLAEMHSFVNRLEELPRAVHGATEALAHMLTDARQIYMNRR